MNHILASAFILPGFYAIQQATSQRQVVYAKSSGRSSSSSSKSSSSSSSSSSSKSSSSSGLFKSSSSSGSSKSLTNRVARRSSSAHSVKPEHVRKSGGKSYVNRRQHAKSRQQDKQLSLMGLFGVLGLATRYFYRYERLRYSIPLIKKALMGSETLNLSVLSKQLDKKLIYGTGLVEAPPRNGNYLTDKLFGVQAVSENALMLRRHVEIFKDNSDSDKPGDWRDSNYIKAFHPSLFNQFAKERAVMPEQVLIGEYELSPEQIIKLAPEEVQRIEIDQDVVDEVFQELNDNRGAKFSGRSNRLKKAFGLESKKEESAESTSTMSDASGKDDEKVIEIVRQKVDEDTEERSLLDSYDRHPFKLADTEGKSIAFTGDYIYICNDMNSLEEGDMRISFSEVKPILEASIIAEQNGASFKEFMIKELEGLKLNLQLFSNGKQQEVRFDAVNIIKEGKIDRVELIEQHVKNSKKQSKTISLILATIIYIVYASIIDHIGSSLNPLNWFGKNAAARREKSKQNAVSSNGKSVTISKNNNLGILSKIIAAPIAGVHIAGVSLFALARTFPAVIACGVVGSYILYTTLKDNQEDSLFINSLDGSEEEELPEDHHEDDEEERILGLISNSNKSSDE